MKTLKIFSFAIAFIAISQISFAQTKTETFNVSGNCGMCKATIEKAAKNAGATTASWDATTKKLTVKYLSSTTNTAKIQQEVASAGYDNAGFKASDAAYSKLHTCCQYDRTAGSSTTDEKADCCKDGKCTKEGHNGADCCKKSSN